MKFKVIRPWEPPPPPPYVPPSDDGTRVAPFMNYKGCGVQTEIVQKALKWFKAAEHKKWEHAGFHVEEPKLVVSDTARWILVRIAQAGDKEQLRIDRSTENLMTYQYPVLQNIKNKHGAPLINQIAKWMEEAKGSRV